MPSRLTAAMLLLACLTPGFLGSAWAQSSPAGPSAHEPTSRGPSGPIRGSRPTGRALPAAGTRLVNYADETAVDKTADDTDKADNKRKQDDDKKAGQLKPITEILPFQDYQPAGEFGKAEGDDKEPARAGSLKLPEDEPLSRQIYTPRQFPATVYAWEASNLWYYPLYFEDTQLERYGQTHHEMIQPLASAGKFGLQLVGLPYQMTIDPIWKKNYPLGYYRPGDHAPKLIHQIPWNTKAAINQAGVTTGLFYLFP